MDIVGCTEGPSSSFVSSSSNQDKEGTGLGGSGYGLKDSDCSIVWTATSTVVLGLETRGWVAVEACCRWGGQAGLGAFCGRLGAGTRTVPEDAAGIGGGITGEDE